MTICHPRSATKGKCVRSIGQSSTGYSRARKPKVGASPTLAPTLLVPPAARWWEAGAMWGRLLPSWSEKTKPPSTEPHPTSSVSVMGLLLHPVRAHWGTAWVSLGPAWIDRFSDRSGFSRSPTRLPQLFSPENPEPRGPSPRTIVAFNHRILSPDYHECSIPQLLVGPSVAP